MPRIAIFLFLAAQLLPSAMMADGSIKMQFRNDSSRPANISGIYTIENGKVIDDNVGSSEIFQPGTTITIDTRLTKCFKVEVWGWLGDYDDPTKEEISARTDLCKNNLLILKD